MIGLLIVNLYSVASLLETCSRWCETSMINNSVCNKECMNLGCNFDSPANLSDVYSIFMASDCFSACNCAQDLLTNSVCDSNCNKFECAYDLGDCGYCASGCFLEDLNSNKFKRECLDKQCFYVKENYLENYFCAPECHAEYINNGICDPMCNTAECFYDFNDCLCSKECYDTSTECLTSRPDFFDPCDTSECNFKDGKCGTCSSGCFDYNLGDGICDILCNNKLCNFDNGDCGCAPGCNMKYDISSSTYIMKVEGSDPCDTPECNVPSCRFGMDFCEFDYWSLKLLVIAYMVYGENLNQFGLINCYNSGCNINDLYNNLYEMTICDDNSMCNSKECLYCMGRYSSYNTYCEINDLNRCFMCDYLAKIEGSCYSISVCPAGYEKINKLSQLINYSLWCLKNRAEYNTNNYKLLYVDSLGDGTYNGEPTFGNLYQAFINVYDSHIKIILLNKENDFFLDNQTSSIFVSDKYDPLNAKTEYATYELWIIGGYSESEKSTVYWRDNLIITSLAKKLFIMNIEFVGKYVIVPRCKSEECYYCPYILKVKDKYFDDMGEEISDEDIITYGACSIYLSVDVFIIENEAYIENVDFIDFRYQFNSFIKSQGSLNLKNVNFSKMQAKADGSIILLECNSDNCSKVSLIYDLGKVESLGAGNNDGYNITTGSFLKSFNIDSITIRNVEFYSNFLHNNPRSQAKGYLFYSKNHIGTIVIEECLFENNYLDYLVYVDVSGLEYSDYKSKKGISLAYSQQHFFMNKVEIKSTYCSKGLLYYQMSNVLHNIKLIDSTIESSIVGNDGMLSFVNLGDLQDLDINRGYIKTGLNIYIQIEPRFIELKNLSIVESCTGSHILYTENYPNAVIKNIYIGNITDCSIEELKLSLSYQTVYSISKVLKNVHEDNVPDLNCSQMVLISNCFNLLVEQKYIEKINCKYNVAPLGLFLQNIIGSANISELKISQIE